MSIQVHDVKEDTYYCLEHAIEYLQERKASQRKHCKLLYTHSKEEVSAIVKMVNARIVDTEEEESSEDDRDHIMRCCCRHLLRSTFFAFLWISGISA